MTLLREILAELSNRVLEDPRILQVRLDNYFSIVQLEDGSVGACMSYYRLEPPDLAAAEARLRGFLKDDPLLLRFLFHSGHDDLVVRSVAASVLSALSARVISTGGDAGFSADPAPSCDPISEGSRAVVIGFGGYMGLLAADARITHLHVSDLSYRERRAEMDAAVEAFQRQRPGLRMSVSDGFDTGARLREADVAFISGSTLCNGTLEGLLQTIAPGTCVILQGQSASVHPAPLFRRGVRMVITTVKPASLLAVAGAARLREVLEGGLPEVYLSPRTVVPRAPGNWFSSRAHLFTGAGYSATPETIYRRFLDAVQGGGRILELGCGNGLLLRYLCDHSPHPLEPVGVDSDRARITQAREIVFADRPGTFITEDVRTYGFGDGPFPIVIANPLYGDRGYYEQQGNEIQRFHGDGSMAAFVRRCYDHLAPGGRLILFCYEGQLREIARWRSAFEGELAMLPVRSVANEGTSVTFFVVDRP